MGEGCCHRRNGVRDKGRLSLEERWSMQAFLRSCSVIRNTVDFFNSILNYSIEL